MKTIVLLGAAVIAGAVRYPIEGPLDVSDDEAARLIESSQAEEFDENASADDADDEDGLENLTLPDLGILVTKEGVPLNGATKKDDIIAAIRAHRADAK